MPNVQQPAWLLSKKRDSFVLKIMNKTEIVGRRMCVHLFYGVMMTPVRRYNYIIINTYSKYEAHMNDYLWTLSWKIMLTS